MRHIYVVMLLALIAVSVTSSYLRGNHHSKNHKHSHTGSEHVSQQHGSSQRSFIQIEDHQMVRQENNLVVAVQLGDEELSSEQLNQDQELEGQSDILSDNDTTLNGEDLDTYYSESDVSGDQQTLTEEATASLPYDVQFNALEEAPAEQPQQQEEQQQIPNFDLPIVEDPTLDFSQETTPLEDPSLSGPMSDQGADLSLDAQIPEMGQADDSSLQQNQVGEESQASDALQQETQIYQSPPFDSASEAMREEAMDSLGMSPAEDPNFSFMQYNYMPIDTQMQVPMMYAQDNYSFVQTNNIVYEATPFRPLDPTLVFEPTVSAECFGDCRIIQEANMQMQ